MFQKNHVYIVAEIGGNFTDYETAKRLIDDAKEAGVDAVKLQTYRAETVASSKAIYDMEEENITENGFDIENKSSSYNLLILKYAVKNKEKIMDLYSKWKKDYDKKAKKSIKEFIE